MNKSMVTCIAAIVFVMMLFTLTACGSSGGPDLNSLPPLESEAPASAAQEEGKIKTSNMELYNETLDSGLCIIIQDNG